MRRIIPCLSLAWVVLTALAIGCSSELPTYPVEGQVVYSDNGQPVQGPLMIWFESTTPPYQRSNGVIDKDGKFSLSTIREGSGSIAGEHRVRIDPVMPNSSAMEQPQTLLARIMDPKYYEFRTSGLVITVQDQGNSVVLKVDPPPGGRRKQPRQSD